MSTAPGRNSKKLWRATGVTAVGLMLAGCLVVPHLDERSPHVSGRVLDATTRAPVNEARVEFIENPALAVITDDRGEFSIRPTRKPELLVPLGGEGQGINYDIGAKIPPRLRVTREGYRPAEIDGTKIENLDASRYERVPSPAEAGPVYLRPVLLERVE